MTKNIILISGKKGSGKSTFTELLVNRLAGKVEVYAMATLLKKVVSTITGCDIKKLEDGEFKNRLSPYTVDVYGQMKNLTYRECLLHFGKMLRYDNNTIFCDDVKMKMRRSDSDYFIVPDLRERIELDKIYELGRNYEIPIITIRITRDTKSDSTSNDKTEIDLDNYVGWDFNVDNNNKRISDLNIAIDHIVKTAGLNTNKPFVEQKLF